MDTEKIYTIYFLQESHRSRIKIGITKNLKERIKSLQTGNSDKLNLIAYLPNQLKIMEHHIHSICKRYRLSGEWFKIEALSNHLLKHPFYKNHIILK